MKRKIRDNVHGDIELSALCFDLIDTPEVRPALPEYPPHEAPTSSPFSTHACFGRLLRRSSSACVRCTSWGRAATSTPALPTAGTWSGESWASFGTSTPRNPSDLMIMGRVCVWLRFEHLLGVAHLVRKLILSLKRTQKALLKCVTEEDILTVQVRTGLALLERVVSAAPI
jgi:hypothetical protein